MVVLSVASSAAARRFSGPVAQLVEQQTLTCWLKVRFLPGSPDSSVKSLVFALRFAAGFLLVDTLTDTQTQIDTTGGDVRP